MSQYSFIPSDQKEVYEMQSQSKTLGYDKILLIGLGVLALQAGVLYGVESLWLARNIEESKSTNTQLQSQINTLYESEDITQDLGTIANLSTIHDKKAIDYVQDIENALLSSVNAQSISYALDTEEKQSISLNLISPTDAGLFDQEVAFQELEFVTEVDFGVISSSRGSSLTDGSKIVTINLTIE